MSCLCYVLKASSVSNSKPLTKNQKRKMRKKRRRFGSTSTPTGNCSADFTFEPEQGTVADEEPTCDQMHSKEVACKDIKEFIQSIWDVYVRQGKTRSDRIWYKSQKDPKHPAAYVKLASAQLAAVSCEAMFSQEQGV